MVLVSQVISSFRVLGLGESMVLYTLSMWKERSISRRKSFMLIGFGDQWDLNNGVGS